MGDLQRNLGDLPLDLAAVRVCLDLLRSSVLSLDFRAMQLNWVTPCTFPTCTYVASYVAVDKKCRRLFTCVLVSSTPPPIVYMCHCPFPSRCACDLLPFGETPPHLTTWTCSPHATVPSAMQGLQWVSLHRAWAVVGCCVILEHIALA